MAKESVEYRFKIEAYSPETIPMGRLADYMRDLAMLLGQRERVHFVCIESGSTTLVQRVEHEADPKVRDRINGVRNRTAPEEAIRAYQQLNERLREDNGSGFVERVDESGILAKVIEFRGRDLSEKERFNSIFQPGTLDGQLIRVGGKDETVPVYLEEQDTIHHCTSNRAVAKKLAPYLYDTLRVIGVGKWNLDDFGNWVMESFRINDFEKLDTTPLSESVARLREIKSNLQAMDDPIGELKKLRGE